MSKEPTTPEGEHTPDEDAAAEAQEAVGQLLRDTRAQQGLDLADVARVLRISQRYLEALETGRTDDLPGPTYAIGFVRSYAEYLNLDGEEIVRRYKAQAEGVSAPADLVFPKPIPDSGVPGAAVLGLGVIVAAVAYGVWYWNSTQSDVAVDRVEPVPERLAEATPEATPDGTPGDAGQAGTGGGDVTGSTGSVAPLPEGATTPTPDIAEDGAPVTPDAPDASAQAAAEADMPAAEANTSAAEATDETDAATEAAAPAIAADETATDTNATAMETMDATAEDTAQSDDAAVPEPAPADETPASASADDTPASASADDTPASASADDTPAPEPDAPAPDAAAPGDETQDTPEEQTVADGADDEAAQTAPTETAQDGPTRITVRAKANSWIQIRDEAQDRLLFTRLLRAGDTYDVPDRDGLELMTGNAGALEILVDGEAIAPLGAVGEVRRNVELDPDKLKSGTAAGQ